MMTLSVTTLQMFALHRVKNARRFPLQKTGFSSVLLRNQFNCYAHTQIIATVKKGFAQKTGFF
jgi:hypothetical protein